jgi:hypothetical protein
VTEPHLFVPATASSSAALATILWAWSAILYGIGLIIGDWVRLPLGLAVALHDVPAAPYVLGGTWLIAGSLGAWGQQHDSLRPRNVGLMTIAVLALGQAGINFYASAVEPTAPVGTGVIFVGIALQVMILRRLETRRVCRDAEDR